MTTLPSVVWNRTKQAGKVRVVAGTAASQARSPTWVIGTDSQSAWRRSVVSAGTAGTAWQSPIEVCTSGLGSPRLVEHHRSIAPTSPPLMSAWTTSVSTSQ